jgi:hypothetical protein
MRIYNSRISLSAINLLGSAPDIMAIPTDLKIRLTRIDSTALSVFASHGLFEKNENDEFSEEAWNLVCAAVMDPNMAETARQAIPQEMLQEVFAARCRI